jgi:DNA repair protein RecN (Recombination protein N)
MLTQIHIRDFATIEELHLSLHLGCTMITGETGAGKSVFVEAIELALGRRASADIIRPGKERADISLCFDITLLSKVNTWLKKHDFYQETNECIIRRIIMSDGRSRCYINDQPVTLPLVRELGELLFHLHSQHEQQILLKVENQRDSLDRYAEHLPLVKKVKQIAKTHKQLDHTINKLQTQMQQRNQRIADLRFRLDELLALQLQPDEWTTLTAEQRKFSDLEKLLHCLQYILKHLFENEDFNVLPTLSSARKLLENIQVTYTKASSWVHIINAIYVQLSDLEIELRNHIETIEFDSERLQHVEQRISELFTLARKHKTQPEELLSLQKQLCSELQTLQTGDIELTELITQQRALTTQYHQLASKLSKSREKAAIKLASDITRVIRSLSLPHGEFQIALGRETTTLSPHGLDKIAFLIKTNPDQPLQPLAKVISGGELSRLSLAIYLSLAQQAAIPTLIFDEIDNGVGGAIAEKTGRLLQQLGETYQVFCITHQAQVAACGHHQLLVEKYFTDHTTHTRLRLLTVSERTKEIARMLGGEKMTKKTLEHAQEVLHSQT